MGVDGKHIREELISSVYEIWKDNIYLGCFKDWKP